MTTEETISNSVCRLLARNGFEHTSYREIAQDSGFDRAHVQYYFPNKKLFASCFYRRMLELSVEYLATKQVLLDEESPIVFSHKVGQIDYAFLQMNKEMLRLTGEMLEYRSIGAMLIEIEYEWTSLHSFYPIERKPDETGFIDFVFWNGGVFECLYKAAVAGEPISPALISGSLIKHSAQAAAIDEHLIDEQLKQATLSKKMLDEGSKYIWTKMVG